MSENRLAILIDAENVVASLADEIFRQAEEMGTVVAREIFGTASALTTWVAPVLKYAMHPNLTIKAAKGKNSSDIALVIGAMDQLMHGEVDTFIIASSDSDFSSLSVRLRNAGKEVVGMGTDKSNDLWRTACTRFVVLGQKAAAPAAPAPTRAQNRASQKAAQKPAAQKPAAQKPAADHAERAAVIEQAMRKRLEEGAGRLQVSTLFPMLNRMREYRQDRQELGMKPLHYLTSEFGTSFVFENTSDGKNWVSLPGRSFAETREETEAGEAAQAEANAEEASQEPEATDGFQPETPEPVVPDAQAAEPEAPQEPEEGEAPREPEAPEADDIRARLIEGGIPEADVDSVIGIFQNSGSTRAAYNRLRSAFGNNNGRAYYQAVKNLAEAQ